MRRRGGGRQTKNILVRCNDLSALDKNLLEIDTDPKLLLSEVENYLNTKLNLLEKKGYAQAKLKLINFKIQQASLEANLYLELNEVEFKTFVIKWKSIYSETPFTANKIDNKIELQSNSIEEVNLKEFYDQKF